MLDAFGWGDAPVISVPALLSRESSGPYPPRRCGHLPAARSRHSFGPRLRRRRQSTRSYIGHESTRVESRRRLVTVSGFCGTACGPRLSGLFTSYPGLSAACATYCMGWVPELGRAKVVLEVSVAELGGGAGEAEQASCVGPVEEACGMAG